jgi:ComF family protein
MFGKINKYFNNLLDLFFPNICVACQTALAGNEQYVCTACLSGLPYTNFWNHTENPIEKIFWGRVVIESAAALVFFEKNSHFQEILHHLKYRGKSELGVLLGRIYGSKIKQSTLAEADIIVPVPLHKSREQKRGFNQSERVAEGLGKSLNIPVVANAAERMVATKTQTSKKRFDRWLNVAGVFNITRPEKFIGKHILVVDDVITTGATSESFMNELLKIPGVKVSFVALASA